MKFLKKGLAVLFACTFVSVPLYHPVKADAVSMDDMGDMNEDQEVSVSDAVGNFDDICKKCCRTIALCNRAEKICCRCQL